MLKKRKKRKKVNFHERRYPKKGNFSKILEQYEKAILEAQYQEQCERFKYLDDIKYAYEVATSVIGRWLSILSKEYYKDKGATYNLAEALLLEVAISEFVFLTNTAKVRNGKEYKEWFEKDRLTDSSPRTRRRGSGDEAWQALKSDKGHYWSDRAQAEAFVSEVQVQVAAADCDEIRMLRDAESARFSSSDMDFEYSRSKAIQSHCDYQSLSDSRSREDIEKALQEWDTDGRTSIWDARVIAENERRIQFSKKLAEREQELREEHAGGPEYSDERIKAKAHADVFFKFYYPNSDAP